MIRLARCRATVGDGLACKLLRVHASVDDFVMPQGDAVEAVANQLRLLADPTRLRVLCALAQGESHVACLAELAGVGTPAASQHLAKLRLAGVVRPRRAGQHVVYELVDPAVRELVCGLLDVSTDGAKVGSLA